MRPREQGARSREGAKPGRARSWPSPSPGSGRAPSRDLGLQLRRVLCAPAHQLDSQAPGDLALHVGCFLKPFQILPLTKRKQHFSLTPFTARNPPRYFQSGSYRITGERSSRPFTSWEVLTLPLSSSFQNIPSSSFSPSTAMT